MSPKTEEIVGYWAQVFIFGLGLSFAGIGPASHFILWLVLTSVNCIVALKYWEFNRKERENHTKSVDKPTEKL